MRLKTGIDKYAILLMRKCINENVCAKFQDYFMINNHNVRTRNKNTHSKIPKVKLELTFYKVRSNHKSFPINKTDVTNIYQIRPSRFNDTRVLKIGFFSEVYPSICSIDSYPSFGSTAIALGAS